MKDLAAFRAIGRLFRIALKHRVHHALEPPPHRWARLILSALKFLIRDNGSSRGENLRDAFLELGPVYIKFGQLISTRRDLLDEATANRLSELQDQVDPINDFDIYAYVSESLGEDWHNHFKSIEQTPLASASIAQVHRAELNDHSAVVIKVVRPDIEAQINADLGLLKWIAEKADQQFADLSRLHLPQIVADHHAVLLQELDMYSEARNQIQLRRNFADSDLLYVPRVYGHLTRAVLLVMEFVEGIPINQIERLRELNVDLKILATKGVETFFTQVFVDNFFHADMHPGNILIDCKDPTNPRYIALDCAIIGSLTHEDRHYLAQNLQAFFNRDYAAVARLFDEAGWVPPGTDLEEFTRVITEVCDPIFAKPLAEISFADFVVELFGAAAQFNMEMQPQQALLQKTLLYIEGLGRHLYPELDLWQTAKPFIERWMLEQYNPITALTALTSWVSRDGSWQVPRLLMLPHTLNQTENQLQEVRTALAQNLVALTSLKLDMAQAERRGRRRRYAGAAFLAVAAVLLFPQVDLGFTEILAEGDITTWTGIVSAVWGSTLIARA